MSLVEKFDEKGNKLSPELVQGTINYLVDIDGTVCEDIPNEEPERMLTAKEIEGAKDAVNKWFADGHIITFFTSRTEIHRKNTEAWLREHGFQYHNIIFGKPRGGNYYFIDDKLEKGIKFTGKFE